jgi:hypothetical protein
MQQLLNVITPADSQALLSLAAMKIKLLIPPTDTTKDALLTELITNMSAVVARVCNRVFGYEKVEETFYQLNDQGNPPSTMRLYLSRWPVKKADIESIAHSVDGSGTSDDLLPDADATWFLEELTGTLYRRPDQGPWVDTIDVVYSGGYALPDDAPPDLTFAAEAAIREQYYLALRNPNTFGVRQLAHKESRISYYPPNMFLTSGNPQTWQTLQAVLVHYTRHWI